ncbi:CTP synthase [Candidatus Shapirobacteria bacterium]|nr:MAG: CTP synthase [Candidatus Shapirobacteria bacterium]
MKFIFVSGGVVSGLGKGISSASIALLLQSKGIRVTNVKIDMYLNVDAGTIRPQEHGEVFVTEDGTETDQDLGNYERFLNKSLRRENYITTGQVYKSVIDKERAFFYQGEDVEAIPHITDEIIDRIKKAGKVNKAEAVIIELGGTVGEYQNCLFFEASRILKLKQSKDVLQVHVSYLPFIKSIGELKSKPVQQSVQKLNSMGIQPDFLIVRSEKGIDKRRRDRLALFCNMKDEDIISNPDLASIYEVPVFLNKQKLAEKIIKKLDLKTKKSDYLDKWTAFVDKEKKAKDVVKIGIVGKYFATGDYNLGDAYVCVLEAIKQASAEVGVKTEMVWIRAEDLEEEDGEKILADFGGVVVPQGWGKRGVEGKIKAVKYARENKVPYLGLCFGMQMAVIEIARNVLGMKGANSVEVNPKTKYPVVHIMPDQEEYLKNKQYGGTIRLGNWTCKIKRGSLLAKIYGRKKVVEERHRHRYEFNNKYRKVFEKEGVVFSGLSPDGKLVEAIELKNHPFFVGTQFHPEYRSRPLDLHPIFVEFVKAVKLI